MEIENPKPRFTIEKCSFITQWAWDTINDFCPICRNSVNEDSITNENDPDINSVVVVGLCGHAFHYDCISRWLKTSTNCPLCNAKWEYQKTMDKDVNNNNNTSNESKTDETDIEEEVVDDNDNSNNNVDISWSSGIPPLPPITVTSSNIGITSSTDNNENITNLTSLGSTMIGIGMTNITSTIPTPISPIIENQNITIGEESIQMDSDDNIDGLADANGHI